MYVGGSRETPKSSCWGVMYRWLFWGYPTFLAHTGAPVLGLPGTTSQAHICGSFTPLDALGEPHNPRHPRVAMGLYPAGGEPASLQLSGKVCELWWPLGTSEGSFSFWSQTPTPFGLPFPSASHISCRFRMSWIGNLHVCHDPDTQTTCHPDSRSAP